MLYNLEWLAPGKAFPPESEMERIDLYRANERYFSSEHWRADTQSLYANYAQRITRVVGNAADYVCFPVLFNYHRLLALKTADLVCGEYPTIKGITDAQNATIKEIREDTDFDGRAYATVLDLCRYGDTVWRKYLGDDGKGKFTIWDIKDWFPIVKQDGTFSIEKDVIAWIVTLGSTESPTYELHVQIHDSRGYESRVYSLQAHNLLNPQGTYNVNRTIGKLISGPTRVNNSFEGSAIIHIRNIWVSGTVYGFDDFTPIDSIVAELMTRVAQISNILDKHSDPSMTGPASMLKQNPETGELYLEGGDFYAVSPNEEQPKYLVWDGELDGAFKQVELLLNQLYVVSEMGSALLGVGGSESGQAISGTAMRFKMTNPLAKARRLSNMLTLPTKQLLSGLSTMGYQEVLKKDISVVWQDGLPDDPKEMMDLVKIGTGETRIVPLKVAIEEYLKRTPAEADAWIAANEKAAELAMKRSQETADSNTQPNKAQGSLTGLKSKNRPSDQQ